MNRIDEHFDRSRFLQTSFYVTESSREPKGGVLPDCDVIFNAISDVDAMPLSHEIAKRIVRASSVPVINPPDIVEQTQRHTNFKALCDLEGAVFPKTIYVTEAPKSEDEADRLFAGCGDGAAGARQEGRHAHEQQPGEDRRYPAALPVFLRRPDRPLLRYRVIDYAGKRGAYIAMRMQFMDGAGFPTRLLINDDWLIYRHRQVKDLMEANPWMLEEAKRFTSILKGIWGRTPIGPCCRSTNACRWTISVSISPSCRTAGYSSSKPTPRCFFPLRQGMPRVRSPTGSRRSKQRIGRSRLLSRRRSQKTPRQRFRPIERQDPAAEADVLSSP